MKCKRSSCTFFQCVSTFSGRTTMQWWWVVLVVLLGTLFLDSSAHLVKEFASRKKEAARSMDPDKINFENPADIQLGAVLCEKYNEWSEWSTCSKKCEQTRLRRCKIPEECGRSLVKEKRTCTREQGTCLSLSYKVIGMRKRNRMIEEILYDLLYSPWTPWGPCTRTCRQRRQRKCKYSDVCIRSYIQEERRCQVKGSQCEHRFSLKPMGLYLDNGDQDDNEDDGESSDTEIETVSDDENPDKGYDEERGPEYNIWDPSEDSENEDEDNEEEDDEGELIFGESDDDSDSPIPEGRPISPEATIFSSPKYLKRRRHRRKHNRRKGRNGEELVQEVATAQRNCGIRPSRSSGSYRVVGGQEVRKNSWPWQVAILTKFGEPYCGGTLIAPKWVLTAAHCVRKKGRRRRLVVRVGEHNINNYDPHEEDIRPEKEFPHPEFNYETITNDIALIKLKHEPSAFTHPGYACLPTEDYVPPRHQLCTIVGWGKLQNNHVYGSESLQEAHVPVVRHRKCQRVFDYPITSKQVCAGYRKGGKDSCAGDSGGPLLCSTDKNNTDKYVLYGVTSYGEGCGRRGKFGIYTRVASYLSWIYRTISQNR